MHREKRSHWRTDSDSGGTTHAGEEAKEQIVPGAIRHFGRSNDGRILYNGDCGAERRCPEIDNLFLRAGLGHMLDD